MSVVVLRIENSKSNHLGAQVSLCTILPSPILYGVWHEKEGSMGGRILRNGRAIVMPKDRLCRWGGQ